MCRFNCVGIGYYLQVRSVVETVLEDLLVRFYDLRMLLGEFLLEIGEDILQRADQ